MLLHGLIIGDKTMGFVNFVGIALNIGYNIFYFLYSDKEGRIDFGKSYVKAGAFVAVLISYVMMEDPEKLEFRFGIIVTIFMFVLISSPLLNVVSFFF